MKLPTLFLRIRIGDEIFFSGDRYLLKNVQISLGEEARSSGCQFAICDNKQAEGDRYLEIGAKFQRISFENGGILVPPDLLEQPQQAVIAGSSGVVPGSVSAGDRDSVVRLIIAECQKQGVTDPAQIAYVLATAEHESKFMPIEEYASGDAYEGRSDLGNSQSGDGRRYKGRGFVQLTGRTNYRKYSELTGQDLVGNPALALDPATAAFILVHGMMTGGFTGRKLSDYIGGGQQDFREARRIVNGTDRADLIAGYAERWLQELPQYLNGNTAMQPIAQPTANAIATTTPPIESSVKGTEIVVEAGFDPTNLISFHFVHVNSKSTFGSQGLITSFEGKSVRWLLTRVPQTRSWDNVTLRDVAQTFSTGAFNLDLDFEGEGTLFSHLDMTGITPMQLLQREARAIGYTILDNGAQIAMRPYGRVEFTNFIIDERLLISIDFSDQARADTGGGGAPASSPQMGAQQAAAVLDRESGAIAQVEGMDVSGTDVESGDAGVVTGAAAAPVSGIPSRNPSLPGQGAIAATSGVVSPGGAIATTPETDTRRTVNDDGEITTVTTTRSTVTERGKITTTTVTRTEKLDDEEDTTPTVTEREVVKIETPQGTETITRAIGRNGNVEETRTQSSNVSQKVLDTLTSTGEAATPTERDIFGLPKQIAGSIDLEDGRAEPAALVDESQRIKGYPATAVLHLTDDTLKLVPGQIVAISARLFPDPFCREFRISEVSQDFGSMTTTLQIYTPMAAPPQSAAVPAVGGAIGLNPGGWIMPIATGSTGDGVGSRGGGRQHKGIDIAAPQGTPLVASADGTVIFVGTDAEGFGNYTDLEHAGGLISRYAHQPSLPPLQVGQQVRQGESVGVVGSSGKSTGAHLHWEIRRGDRFGEVVLPSEVGITVPPPYRDGFRY